jgi:hypothetical protein
MKTIIKTLAFALLSAVSVSNVNANNDGKPAEANKSFQTSAYRPSDKVQVNLFVTKKSGSSLKVMLKNDKSQVLFTGYAPDKIEKCGWKIDMSNLEDGTYKLVITDGVSTETKEVVLDTKQTIERNIAVN